MTTVKINNPDTVYLDARLAIVRYLPYWPLFLALVFGCFLSAFFYLSTTTPLFEANAKILIVDEKRGAENAKAMERTNLLQSKKIIENELDVITAKPLLYEVINKLQLYATVYKKKSIGQQLMYHNSPVFITAKNPEVILTTQLLPFTIDRLHNKILINQQAYLLDSWQKTPYGELQFSINKNLPETEFTQSEYSFQLLKLKDVAGAMAAALTANSTAKLSSMIEISYKDPDPQRAEAVVNNLLFAYINTSKTEKNNLANNTISFIEERLKIVEKDLQAIEQKKQQYTASKGAFNIGTQGRLYLENVSSNDQKMSEINMKLAMLNEVESYVNTKQQSSGVVPATMGVTDPLLSQLVDKLYAAELEFQTLKKTTAENHPVIIAIADRIEKIRPDITELISNQRKGLQSSIRNITATNNNYAAVLNTMPATERDLVDIDRQQNIKSGIYTYLLQKKEETALSQQSSVPESKIISLAESGDYPVSPNKKKIYAMAFLIATLLAFGMVTAKEKFSNKVLFRHEIESFTGMPVIGEICTAQSKDPIVISDDKKTFIAEQFRRLRITLSYLNINSTHKKLLVTSSISGEGKSFIASNLALTLALTGKKVVLLDFDLNNPSLNNKLNISNNKGITDFLLGESTIADIIFPTDLDPNLFLISTGLLPHNPTELLLNGKIEILLQSLENNFDFIVIDTAPTIPVTDAYILSPLCDATLYVVRHSYTPKIFLQKIDAHHTINQLHNVGIVFNSISSRGLGKNNYGYGYGYGYSFKDSTRIRQIKQTNPTP